MRNVPWHVYASAVAPSLSIWTIVHRTAAELAVTTSTTARTTGIRMALIGIAAGITTTTTIIHVDSLRATIFS
jgi:hypothetical protein